jgi:hypothetical protein
VWHLVFADDPASQLVARPVWVYPPSEAGERLVDLSPWRIVMHRNALHWSQEAYFMANKGSFTPGDPRAGRPPGATNKTSRDARALAQSLVSDPAYLDKLKQRLIDGKAGDLEKVLWQYAYGAPPQHPVTIMDDFLEGLPPLGRDADG